MEFFEILNKRRSIRSFLNDPVDEATIDRILSAANLAPSAGNRQAYEIIVVNTANRRAQLASAVPNMSFLATAPLMLVFCANPIQSEAWYTQRGRDLYCIQDATIACTYAMLAATALGLGSVWVGAFKEEAVLQAINFGKSLVPVAILAVGFPAEDPEPRPRRTLESIAHRLR